MVFYAPYCVDGLCFIDDESTYDDVDVVFDFSFPRGFPDDVRDTKIASNAIHANWIGNPEKI